MTQPDPGRDDATVPDDAPVDALRSVRGESVATAIGSFMAGIEQQVFQRRPPAVELVRDARPVRGVSGDGLEVTIMLPDQDPSPR